MLCKVSFRAGLYILLLTVASCSAPEEVASKDMAQVNEVETAQTGSGELIGDDEVIVSLGDKKLTMQQVKWMQEYVGREPVRLAKWWLENELLYAEVQRRGITEETKAEFLAELQKKASFSRQLRMRVEDAVKIGDKDVMEYYEKNKKTDPTIKISGFLSFSHVRTKTLEEAQAVLEKIKAGKNINTLARKLSIHKDAKKGGVVKHLRYESARKSFGVKFFKALVAAKKGELIGPIEIGGNAYEVARQEDKLLPKILPYERVRKRIGLTLQQEEQEKVYNSLLESLKEKAADKIVKSPRLIQMEESAGEGAGGAKGARGPGRR